MSRDGDDRDKGTLAALQGAVAAMEAMRTVRASGQLARQGLLAQMRDHKAASPYLAAQTFWGGVLVGEVGEVVCESIFVDTLFEPGLSEFFVRWLRPGDTVIDVGGHIGYFTALAAHLVGESGAVHVLEPGIETGRQLARNVGFLPQIHRHAAAAWSARGEMELTEFERGYSAFSTIVAPRLPEDLRSRLRSWSHRVPTVALDDLVAEHALAPALVKIDAEGAEREIVRGMERILSEHRPAVTIEVGDEGFLRSELAGPNREILDAIRRHGYVAVEWVEGRFRRHSLKPSWTYAYDNIFCLPEEAFEGGGGPARCRGGPLVVEPLPDLFRNGRMVLGPEPCPGIVADGFHGLVRKDGMPCRWTGGRLRLVADVPPDRTLSVLELDLWPLGLADRAATVRVNGTAVFDGRYVDLVAAKTLSLAAVPPGSPELVVELVVETFTAPGDSRALGACVRRIAVVAGTGEGAEGKADA